MLEADERQEWTHQSGKIAEMAELMWVTLEASMLPHHLAEQLLVIWWTQMLTPRVEMPQFPDFGAIFRQDEEE